MAVPVPARRRHGGLVRVRMLAFVAVRVRMDGAAGVFVRVLMLIDRLSLDPGVAFAATASGAHGSLLRSAACPARASRSRRRRSAAITRFRFP
jgi:hypothetical protein